MPLVYVYELAQTTEKFENFSLTAEQPGQSEKACEDGNRTLRWR